MKPYSSKRLSVTKTAVLCSILGCVWVSGMADESKKTPEPEPAKGTAVPQAAPSLERGSVLAVSTTDESADAVLQRQRKSGSGVTNLPPRSVTSHGGVVPYVARERKVSKVLQLLNPFAPSSLGTGGAVTYEWNSMVNPGAGVGTMTLPRVFRDERTTEPVGIQIIGTPR